jgi:hypothetical protein
MPAAPVIKVAPAAPVTPKAQEAPLSTSFASLAKQIDVEEVETLRNSMYASMFTSFHYLAQCVHVHLIFPSRHPTSPSHPYIFCLPLFFSSSASLRADLQASDARAQTARQQAEAAALRLDDATKKMDAIQQQLQVLTAHSFCRST